MWNPLVRLKTLLDKLLVQKLWYIGMSESLPAPLERGQEAALIEKLAGGDEKARDE